MKITNKKGGVSVSAIIFLLLLVMLVATSISVFISSNKGAEEKLEPAVFINKMYDKEAKIKFYVETTINISIKETIEEGNFTIEKFKEKMKEKLLLVKEETMQKIAEDLESEVFYSSGILKITIPIVIEEK